MNYSLPLNALDASELFRALKNKKLKGPNAVAYDPQAWIASAAAISIVTMRDADLLCAALHFGSEFNSLRSLMEGKLPRLTPLDAVDFVVASLNVQTNTVVSQTRAKLRKQTRVSEIGYMGDTGTVRVHNSGHQKLSPDDAMANLVDGTANLLFRASDTERVSSSVDRDNALRSAQTVLTFASIEQGLKNLWGRAAWEGGAIKKAGNQFIFTAGDETFSKLWIVWQRRFETIMLQEVHLQAGAALVQDDRRSTPPVLKRTVVGLQDRCGRKKEYIVGKARRRGDEQASTLCALEASYLSSFLDEVLPNYSKTGLTYRDLWRAWWILQDIAELHQALMPSRGFLSWNQIDQCVLRFSVSSATKAIADALQIPLTSATIMVELFTTDPDLANRQNASDLFKHGTWGRPILRSKKEDRGRIVLAPLISPNPVMTMELWMTRTGMIDDPKQRHTKTIRGKVFEKVARERIRAAGAQNRHLADFSLAALPARGEGTEEIDALLRFGSTIVVCEMKCLNVPFEPLDRYNHLGKIDEAVGQVNRKTAWAQVHSAQVFDALLVPEGKRDHRWQFVPVVVLNTAFGAGLLLGGCGVTDLDWLSTFLGSPDITVAGIFERGRGASMQTRAVYKDQVDLERRFTEVAVSPPSLAFELGRIEWEFVPFPTRLVEPLLLRIPVSKGTSNPASAK